MRFSAGSVGREHRRDRREEHALLGGAEVRAREVVHRERDRDARIVDIARGAAHDRGQRGHCEGAQHVSQRLPGGSRGLQQHTLRFCDL